MAGEEHNNLLTTGQLADELGRTEETVRRWATQGLPHRWSGDGAARHRLIERGPAMEWIRANRGATLHGGRRRGAGRKPGPEARERARSGLDYDAAARERMDREEAAELLRRLVAGDCGPLDSSSRLPVDGLLGLSHREIQVLALLPEGVTHWTPNAATRFQQLQRARQSQMEIDKEAGKLVPVSDVERASRELARTFVEALEGLSEALASDVAAAMAAPDGPARVRSIVEGAVLGLRTRLAGGMGGAG